ncbi:hypothetical protein OAM69_00210 [bacterium]|nr:hypothetical protein [bacterium]
MGADFAMGASAVVVATQPVKTLWMPVIGIPIAGLIWSVAAIVINAKQVVDLDLELTSVLLLVMVGGMAQTVAVWVGFSAIVWAMVRGFGKRLALLRVLRLTSGASWPLWWGAPAIAFWLSGAESQTPLIAVIGLSGLSGFFVLTAQALAKETEWSTLLSMSAVGASVVFISSFVYLNI